MYFENIMLSEKTDTKSIYCTISIFEMSSTGKSIDSEIVGIAMG